MNSSYSQQHCLFYTYILVQITLLFSLVSANRLLVQSNFLLSKSLQPFSPQGKASVNQTLFLLFLFVCVASNNQIGLGSLTGTLSKDIKSPYFPLLFSRKLQIVSTKAALHLRLHMQLKHYICVKKVICILIVMQCIQTLAIIE